MELSCGGGSVLSARVPNPKKAYIWSCGGWFCSDTSGGWLLVGTGDWSTGELEWLLVGPKETSHAPQESAIRNTRHTGCSR